MNEKPVFFKTSEEFRQWLEENHNVKDVLWVGYYKVATGKPSMRWEESVREALCYGWIDGLRKSIDDEAYKIRFTPRRPNSHWSLKNIEMVEELKNAGRMQPAGLEAFDKRKASKTGTASYESMPLTLEKEFEDQIKASKKAWDFFTDLPPGYTRQSIHWVMSAKREDTRRRRLQVLIKSSEEGKKIPPLRYGDK